MLYWILIASAARARLFSMSAWTKPLKLERELDYQPGRTRAQDLLSDEPGRYSKGGKRGILSAMERRVTPHQAEEHKFAHQLAEILEAGAEHQQFNWLAIFAPPQFLGILRETISEHVRKSLIVSEPKDLVDIDARDLPKHLTMLYPLPIADPVK
jgi:protein required for attachment to host cells